MLMEQKIKDQAVKFKALCDENRLKIVEQLQEGQKCAYELLDILNITQPTLSHHMKILCESGLVEGKKDGRWMHYSLNADEFNGLTGYLEKFTS